MTETTSDKAQIFKKIEDLYFSSSFKELITFWEENGKNYKFEKESENDNNLLESLAVSYYETLQFEKSLIYRNIQINHLKFVGIADHLKTKKYKHYYGEKIDIFIKRNNKLLVYRTLWEYMNQFGIDDEFKKMSDSLEDFFYQKYLRLLKFMFYVLLALVIIVILIYQLGFEIPKQIYGPYNIISIIGFSWVILHLFFSRFFRQIAYREIKYFLRPR